MSINLEFPNYNIWNHNIKNIYQICPVHFDPRAHQLGVVIMWLFLDIKNINILSSLRNLASLKHLNAMSPPLISSCVATSRSRVVYDKEVEMVLCTC